MFYSGNDGEVLCSKNDVEVFSEKDGSEAFYFKSDSVSRSSENGCVLVKIIWFLMFVPLFFSMSNFLDISQLPNMIGQFHHGSIK